MDVDKVEEKAPAIDDALYSRQLYVFGHQAQAKLGSSNVLIVGLKGLGVEIAKNVILAGVKSVALLDNDPVEIRDLGAQFYLTEQHVGKPRAACSVDQLASLNPYVNTYVVSEPLNEALLSKYTVVVLTGRPVAEQVQINKFCHANGIKTVVADIFGLGAAVFVDVGEQHVIEDPSGEQPARGLITHISQGNPGVVTVHEDKRHGLETGMWVTFEEVEGMTQLNNTPPRQIKVISPFSFSIEDTTGYSEYKGEGYFQQVNVPISLKHQTLEAALANVTGVITWDVFGHALPMHVLYQAISAFRGKHGGAFPSPTQPEHAQEVVALAKEYAATAKVDVQFDAKTEKMLLQLARCSGASLSPMAAFVGGFAGQEVLKACSGKFTPLTQLLYFDAAEALPADDLAAGEYAPQNHRYDDQIAVFGRTFQQTLSDQAYFLVGAGAIGCEMLKNWALMGVATGGKGRIHVTDMDQIEKSNLNRQFLFRAGDVGKLKSETAAGAVQKMNPACRVDAAAERVGPGTEHIYDDAFWESLSACVTALDNVDARLYCDQRCLYYQKPMVDSGTLGTKGNTQVVLPRLTESYGASRDPPEESIPICTLKNFPNKIEHTIQWARDTFEGWFRQAVEDVNSYLSKPTYLAELAKQPNTQLDSLKNIHNYLVTERPLTFEDCIKWARLKFEELFNHTVLQLLHNFPEDSVTSTGTKFWSGTKRAPAALVFNPQDSEHINFVIAAANLRAFNYGLKGDSNPDAIRSVLAGVNVPPFQPKSVKIATSEAEAKEQAANSGDDDLTVKVKELEGQLPAPASMAGYTLHPSIFEKDDDTNFHMAFVTACSNLRARNYRIKEQNIHQTKFIAGKIIPAIATTTAAVTGLVCLELYKIIQNKPLEAYRNTFINLALPLVTGSEPTPPKTQVAKLKTGEWKWSSWDRIEINEGDITLQQLFNIFKERYGLVASMVSFGSSLLFMGLPGMKSKHADRLNMKLSEIIKNVAKVELKPKEKYVALEICVSGEEDDEDVEIPYVRVNLRG